MLNFAAMLVGLWLMWLCMGPHFGGLADFIWAGAAALGAGLVAARLGALEGRGGPYASGAANLALAFARGAAAIRGALGVAGAAFSADMAMRPALVRLRTRPASGLARAAFANLVTAAPGALVTDSDSEGLLVHVLDEEGVDADALARLEGRVIGAIDGKAAS